MQIRQIIIIVMLAAIMAFPNLSVGAILSNKERHIKLVLESSSAIIIEQETGKIIFEKKAGKKKAIASITKLMTAMVVLDSNMSLNAPITISREDVDRQRWSKSKLSIGQTLSRREMLKLALMSSENRAAYALARSYYGGTNAFVAAMNRNAAKLGMNDTTFFGPTGLDARNVSTARDLAIMVKAAYEYQQIRKMSTSVSHSINDHSQRIICSNTNRLVKDNGWKIGLSKTGYISDSGKCLVMQATLGGVPTIIVLLDSWGISSRIVDAIRVKRWLAHSKDQHSIRG